MAKLQLCRSRPPPDAPHSLRLTLDGQPTDFINSIARLQNSKAPRHDSPDEEPSDVDFQLVKYFGPKSSTHLATRAKNANSEARARILPSTA